MAKHNKRIILTRPEAQSESWREKVEKAGYRSCSIPSLAIVAVEQEQHIQAIKNTILSLDEMSQAIFVSQNAVNFGFDWIEQYWPQMPQGIDFHAVGAATQSLMSDKLQAMGYALSSNAEFKSMNSEELLALPSLQDVDQKKIIIFRGLGGRTLLGDTLEQRGAKIFYCELYERRLPLETKEKILAARLDWQKDVIPIFSAESLQNIHRLMKENHIENWQKIPLICPSQRVVKIAREMGFVNCHCAENASEPAMWLALTNLIADGEI